MPTASWTLPRNDELLVDGFSTKITRVRAELRMLVYPSSIDLSSRTPRFLTGQLAARQAKIGDIDAQLAAGFGIGIATVYR